MNTNYKIERVYEQIPSSKCPPSCGKCCGILYPARAEIRNIYQWLEKKGKPFKPFNMTAGIDCPYLAPDKSCEIYPVRPFLCRILGVFQDLPCPTRECNPERIIPSAQGRALYKAIYLHGKEKKRINRHKKILGVILQEAMRKHYEDIHSKQLEK